MKRILLYQGLKADDIYSELKRINEIRPYQSFPSEFGHITSSKSYKPKLTSYIYNSALLTILLPDSELKKCRLLDNEIIDKYYEFNIYIADGKCLFIFGVEV